LQIVAFRRIEGRSAQADAQDAAREPVEIGGNQSK
jgi:hypothetical protein